MTGRVIIAGAGPGGIDHLTVGVLREIKAADVILYDALIGESIIAEFPEQSHAECVGKRCGRHTYTQTMVIATLVNHALQGKRVLRLKGGDPAVFAHLSSELEALHALEIPVKVLPGVTAATAAAAALQRPLTRRGQERHIWITDGHAADLRSLAPQLAAFPGTLVFYMGASRLQEIAISLEDAGMPRGRTCVLVENAGSDQEEVQQSTLEAAAAGLIVRQSRGPGIFLVGDALSGATAQLTQPHAAAIQL